MPGNVVAAAPTVVMPNSLCTAFQRSKTWETLSNFYSDGRHQRGALVGSERNVWVLHKRLTVALIDALELFYSQQQFGAIPFFFYDPYDSGFTYDPTGVQVGGRYTVRFEGGMVVTGTMPRVETDVTLVQVA